MKTDLVIGLGEVVWDNLPDGSQIGGAPANFAFHASQLGCRSILLSAVGDDPRGDEMVEELNRRKLRHRLTRTVQAPTGEVDVLVDEAGQPRYDIRRPAAWDFIAFDSQAAALARDAAAVCFGTLAQRSPVSRESIRRFLEAVPAGALRIFDVNMRQDYYSREVVEDSLKLCNILKINADEAQVLASMFGFGTSDENSICRRLCREYSLSAVILTLGARGSRIFSDRGEEARPTIKSSVVDTVGAGDSFTAAFCVSLLQGRTISEAHRRAAEVAAFVCASKGAMPVLPESVVR